MAYDNFLEELQNLFKSKEIHIDSLEIDIYIYMQQLEPQFLKKSL